MNDLEQENYIINGLLDIAEKHYPKHSSCNFIAECDDYLKLINNEKE